MLAGAIQQYLKAQGLSPVFTHKFGDYSAPAAPQYCVHTEADGDAELDGGCYRARAQLRARARDVIAAENAGRAAHAALLAADGAALAWTDPEGGPSRTYRLEAIQTVNRPTWYPTPEQGEETSCNLRLFVTEI